MAGSLWRQDIGSDGAVELTHGPGYDYQPDWSPDGKRIVFVRHDDNTIELWQLDVSSGKRAAAHDDASAVNLEPRYSPDGKRLAYVSTAGSGHFNLFVAPIEAGKLGTPRAVVEPRESKIARYYYSKHDHAINPSWTPDGKRLVFVSNREVAYGTRQPVQRRGRWPERVRMLRARRNQLARATGSRARTAGACCTAATRAVSGISFG